MASHVEDKQIEVDDGERSSSLRQDTQISGLGGLPGEFRFFLENLVSEFPNSTVRELAFDECVWLGG